MKEQDIDLYLYLGLLATLRELHTFLDGKVSHKNKYVLNRSHKEIDKICKQFKIGGLLDNDGFDRMVELHLEVINSMRETIIENKDKAEK